MAPSDMHFIVETAESVIERCMLMTTEPGNLILDPTCGSGTTALVAERWGRRWITTDINPVQISLCRQRIITSINEWYLTKDSAEGIREEARLAKVNPPPPKREMRKVGNTTQAVDLSMSAYHTCRPPHLHMIKILMLYF